VMPRIELTGDGARVVMPWDPDYGRASGEGCEATAEFPAHFTRRRGSYSFKPASRPPR
jgi:hypothetical protein